MQDWKMTDQIAGVDTARLENDTSVNNGRKMTDVNLKDEK